jgi:uncharacterized protein (TIGR03000 family)
MIRNWWTFMGGAVVTAAMLLFAAGATQGKGGGGGGHSGGGHSSGGHSSSSYGGSHGGSYSGSHGGGHNMHHHHNGFFFGGAYYPYWWYNYDSAYYSYPSAADASASAPEMYQAFYPPPQPSGNVPVLVRVWMPADAELWFNGTPASQKGTYREFMSPPLPPGKGYVYEVRARWIVGGQPVEQTRTVRVHAGDRVSVDFTQAAASNAR